MDVLQLMSKADFSLRILNSNHGAQQRHEAQIEMRQEETIPIPIM